MDQEIRPSHHAATANAANPLQGASGLHIGPGFTLRQTGIIRTTGQITVAGGPGGPGGTLIVQGTIDSGGTTTIGAGTNANGTPGSGGQLDIGISGVFDNSGDFVDYASAPYYSSFGSSGTGGGVRVAGLFSNSGDVTLQGGATGYAAAGQPARMDVIRTGTIDNAGQFVVGGGSGGGVYSFASGAGATLSLAGTFTNGGTLDIQAASTAGYRAAQATSGGVLNDTGILTNSGSIVVGGSQGYYGALGERAPAGALSVTQAGILVNLAAASLTLGGGSGGNDYLVSGNGALLADGGFLKNEGTILAQGGAAGYFGNGGGAIIQVTGLLQNTGLITLQGGSTYGGSYGGQGAQLTDAAHLANTGTILIGNATGQGAGAATLSVSGVFTNDATVTVGTGTSYYGGGQLTVAARGTLASLGTITVQQGLGGADAAGTLTVSGNLQNDGGLTVAGGDPGYPGFGYGLGYGGLVSIQSGAELFNTGGITLQGGVGGFYGSPWGQTGGALQIAGAFDNTGTLTAQAGGPAFRSGSGGGASVTLSGTMTNSGDVAIQGSAGYNLGDGLSRGFAASFSVTGTGVLANATVLSLSGGYAFGIGGGYGAKLNDAGQVINTGTITAGGGQDQQYAYEAGTGALIAVSGVLTNNGLIDLQGDTLWYPGATGGSGGSGAALTVSGRLVNSGIISLDAATGHGSDGSVTVTSTGTLVESGTITGAGTLTNNGQVLASGGTGALQSALQNNGQVSVDTGTFTLGGAVSTATAGSFLIGTHAALDLAAAVAAGQTVDFTAQSSLLLGDATGFSGLLSGLAAGDLIDFQKLDVTAASASPTTLALTLAGSGVLDIGLGTAIAPGTSLNLQSDGAGGTDLLLK
jgi:hypothetical protein